MEKLGESKLLIICRVRYSRVDPLLCGYDITILYSGLINSYTRNETLDKTNIHCWSQLNGELSHKIQYIALFEFANRWKCLAMHVQKHGSQFRRLAKLKNFDKEAPQIQHLCTVYRRRNVTDGYIALCHTMCGILTTFLSCGAPFLCDNHRSYSYTVCDLPYSGVPRLLMTENVVFLFLVAESSIYLDALTSSLGLTQSVFVILLCVGDRLTKTAVTGIRSCYCVYYRVNRLYSKCFVSKIAPLCAVLASYLTLF